MAESRFKTVKGMVYLGGQQRIETAVTLRVSNCDKDGTLSLSSDEHLFMIAIPLKSVQEIIKLRETLNKSVVFT